MSLSVRAEYALRHMGQVLKEEGVTKCVIDVYDAKVDVQQKGDTIKLVNIEGHNPIQSALDSVVEEVCTDCLKDRYNFRNPYFVSLIKSYLEVLILRHGAEVPITRTIAQVALKHDLTRHDIAYRGRDRYLYNVKKLEHPMFDVDTTQWFLVEVDNGRKRK